MIVPAFAALFDLGFARAFFALENSSAAAATRASTGSASPQRVVAIGIERRHMGRVRLVSASWPLNPSFIARIDADGRAGRAGDRV